MGYVTKQKRHPFGCLLNFVVNFDYLNIVCINSLQNIGQINFVNTEIDFLHIRLISSACSLE